MSRHRKGSRIGRTRPVQLAVYLLLRTVFMVIGMFPWSAAPVIGRWVGKLLRLFDRRHVAVAAKNLGRSRGVCAPDAIPAFIDRVYHHIGVSFSEMLMLPRLMARGQIEAYRRFHRFEVAEAVIREGRGLIVAIGHLGNWEIIGLAICKAGYPLNSLARPITNPWIDEWLTKFRTQTGQKIIYKNRALGEMVRVLQRKEILIVQVDQNAKSAGVMTTFFDRPASTHRSPAILSLKYGTPIMVANIYREGNLHHCVLNDPIRPDAYRGHADPVLALTQEYTTQLESFVRAHPEQWLWAHDRWKAAEKAAGPSMVAEAAS